MSNPEKIEPQTVVGITYTLKDESGDLIESNKNDEPLSFLFGTGQIIPGLENALEGKGVGETASVVVTPDEGYGISDPEKIFEVPKDRFDGDIEVGTVVQAQVPDAGMVPFMVIGLDGDQVKLDGNHPLAGKTLNFEVDIISIRAATEEELKHDHSHDGHCGHDH